VILNNDDDLNKADTRDKAEGASSNIDTRRIKRDISLYDTFATLELALAPTESIDTPSL
jgi:hypothetical protein